MRALLVPAVLIVLGLVGNMDAEEEAIQAALTLEMQELERAFVQQQR